jgi:hypothetical protein
MEASMSADIVYSVLEHFDTLLSILAYLLIIQHYANK